jgi:hypothetical protein
LDEELGACRFKCCRKKTTADDALFYSSMVDDSEVFELFLNHPPLTQMQNPLEAEKIQQFQFADMELENHRQQQPHRFPIKMIQGRPLVCYCTHPTDLVGDWKIALPKGLINDVIQWYHRVLVGHCGIVRMYDTIRAHCHHPQLKQRIEAFNCDACHRHKLLGAGYGELPPREAPLLPWDEVAVDLIDPWKVEVQGQEIEFNALTSIDPVTNLVEMI